MLTRHTIPYRTVPYCTYRNSAVTYIIDTDKIEIDRQVNRDKDIDKTETKRHRQREREKVYMFEREGEPAIEEIDR